MEAAVGSAAEASSSVDHASASAEATPAPAVSPTSSATAEAPLISVADEAPEAASSSLPPWHDSYAQLKTILSMLQADDKELTKLFVCRFVAAWELEQRPFLSKLQQEGLLDDASIRQSNSVADVDALIAAARTGGGRGGVAAKQPFTSASRAKLSFVRTWASGRSAVRARRPSSISNPAAAPAADPAAAAALSAAEEEPPESSRVDSSAGPGSLLLSRLGRPRAASSVPPRRATLVIRTRARALKDQRSSLCGDRPPTSEFCSSAPPRPTRS